MRKPFLPVASNPECFDKECNWNKNGKCSAESEFWDVSSICTTGEPDMIFEKAMRGETKFQYQTGLSKFWSQ